MTLERPQLFLGGVSGLLVLVIAFAWLLPFPDIATPSVQLSAVAQNVPVTPPAAMPAPDAVAAIDARPVFDPSRQPVAAPADANAKSQAPTLPSLTLVGVIIDGATRLALIRTSPTGFAMSYAVGTSLGGWQIAEIEADRIVLRAAGAADQEIRLSGSGQAAPQAQQAGDGL